MREQDPRPIPRQSPQAAAWVALYRELIAARGSAAALTREDMALLAAELSRGAGVPAPGAQDQPAQLAARTADATPKGVRHSSRLDFHLAPAAPGRRDHSRAAPAAETD